MVAGLEPILVVKRTCPVCLEGYKRTHGGQKFCSATCRRKANHQKHRIAHNAKAIQYQETPNGKYAVYKKMAVARGISFPITKEEFLAFWDRPCVYCGDAIQTVKLDRVDSGKGYSVGNVVPCCSWCNYGKLTRTAEEYIKHCHRVAALHPLDKTEEIL